MKGFLTFSGVDETHSIPLPRDRFTFGAGPSNDVAVSATGLPAYGGSFTWDDGEGTWMMEAPESARAVMLLDGGPLRSGRVALHDGALLEIQSFFLRFDLLPEMPVVDGKQVRVIPLTGRQIKVGRGNEEGDPAKVVLDPEDGAASRLHAVLERRDGAWFIKDESQEGTELNGRLFEEERLVIGDRFRIGHYYFEFTGRSLRRLASAIGGRLTAQKLTREAGGRCILQGVSMDVPPGSFVGILGGSGQGKSTLMTALCGLNPATSGMVYLDGEVWGAGRAEKHHRVGFVPQDDIVHSELTVRKAITYSARLRLQDDPPASEIDALVQAAAARLSLDPHLDKPVARLSGGQRKRVSIATELLAKPSVLFLDEPSSGLDPATEYYLMAQLRDLAGRDCTVLCTTHVLGRAYAFDRIAFVQGGRLVFYGPAADALAFFGKGTLEEVYLELDPAGNPGARPAEEWQKVFEASASRPQLAPVIPVLHDCGAAPPARGAGWWRTLMTLLCRQWSILCSDRANLIFLLAQAMAVAALIGWVAVDAGLWGFLCVIAVLWFGCSNAAQQIVGELPIFRRERVCGMGVHVYLQSKVLFSSLSTFVQCSVVFIVVTATGCYFHPAPFDEQLLLRDPRFGGGLENDLPLVEETPGGGILTLQNAFGFSKSAAADIASFFRSGDARNEDGSLLKDRDGHVVPSYDEAAIERTAEDVGARLLARGVDLKSDEARIFVRDHLRPENAPQAPPRAARPSAGFVKAGLMLTRWFGLQENVLGSAGRSLRDKNGDELHDPVSRRVKRFPDMSLQRVLLVPVLLRFFALCAAAFAGVAIGLVISALVSTGIQAAMVVPLVLIPQILLGGFVVIRPEMKACVHEVSLVMPSGAAEQVFEVGELFGQRVPLISNRTRIPAFVKAEPHDGVEWNEGGTKQTEEYERASEANTAFQNLVVNPQIVGLRKKEVNKDSGDPLDNVKSSRRDVEPYAQGTLYDDLSPARDGGVVLGCWVLACHIIAYLALRLKPPL